MHELAITKGIIDIVESEKKDKGFERVIEISLRIGEFSGIVPRCIREFFPIAAAGTAAENAQLKIETIEAAFQCFDCGYEGSVDRKAACCPKCRSTAIRMTRGREFFVEQLKVE